MKLIKCPNLLLGMRRTHVIHTVEVVHFPRSLALYISWNLSLTSCVITSKAVTMFEDDKRFKAVEQEADREDLFRNYSVDLQKKVHNSVYFFRMLRHLVIYILVNFDTFQMISRNNPEARICKHDVGIISG